MATRTATYNSISLGDYLVPIKENELDIGDSIEWGIQISPIFDSTTAITRYSGPRLQQKIIRFAKELGTDQLLNAYFDTLRSSLTPLIGSINGASLVITDGTTAQTYTHVKITKLDKIYNIQGLAYFEATFISPA